jgi:hypothetical protein
MPSDEVGVDRDPEDAKPLLEIVIPSWRVPVGRTTFQQFRTPDVVDQNVDVAVLGLDLCGPAPHLIGVEMVDRDRDTGAPEARDQFSGLLDGLWGCSRTELISLYVPCR